MIREINIYSDTTVLSYDLFDCLVPHASGTWAVIPIIVSWITEPYPAHLPDECKCKGCKIYFNSKITNEKIPISIIHFIKIGKFIESCIKTPTMEELKMLAQTVDDNEFKIEDNEN